MQEFHAKRIATPDGFVLELHEPNPLSPFASSLAGSGVQVPPTGKPDSASDDDESTDKEDRAEKDLKEAWNDHWRRIGLSSGSGVPKFPGVERAQRWLGRYS